MIASALRQWASAAAVCVPLAAASCCEAAAADASPWDGDARSAVRLVAGNVPNGETLRAGVELRLAAGWKTYWRYPGDSGVPPVFDFSKSENVKSVALSWPAPHRFTDEGGSSIGYKGGVVLPLRVVPENPRRPVTLRLDLDYAICERLCIPAKGSARLELGRAPSLQDTALAAAPARGATPAPPRRTGRPPGGTGRSRRPKPGCRRRPASAKRRRSLFARCGAKAAARVRGSWSRS